MAGAVERWRRLRNCPMRTGLAVRAYRVQRVIRICARHGPTHDTGREDGRQGDVHAKAMEVGFAPVPNADSNVANDDFPEFATALRSRVGWRSTAHSMSLRRWQPVNSAVLGGGRRLEPRGGRPSAKRHASGWDGSMPWNESATSLVRCPLLPHGFPPESRNPAGIGSTRTASWPGQTIPCRCAAAPGCLAPTGVDRIVDRLRAPRHFLPGQAMDSGSGARCRVHPSDGSGPRGMPGPVSETSEKGKQPATGMGSSPQLRWAIAAL
jgi:hypothetical protein